MRNRDATATRAADSWLTVFELQACKQRQLIQDLDGVNNMLNEMDSAFQVLLND